MNERMIDRASLTPKDRLVFPLDVPDWKTARPIVERLKGEVGFFKVGLELFFSEGPGAVRELAGLIEGTAGIFLDLKLHDIPATVGRAMSVVSSLKVDLVTVHVEGGTAMLEAAKASAGSTRVLGVTVLTSLDLSEEIGLAPQYTDPLNLVLLRARRAVKAGCDGLVCSGAEAAAVREAVGPRPLIVTPGIRPAWSLVEGDDQKRVMTPAEAIAAGSDFLVVGRPIRDAEDQALAAFQVVTEIQEALKQ